MTPNNSTKLYDLETVNLATQKPPKITEIPPDDCHEPPPILERNIPINDTFVSTESPKHKNTRQAHIKVQVYEDTTGKNKVKFVPEEVSLKTPTLIPFLIKIAKNYYHQ